MASVISKLLFVGLPSLAIAFIVAMGVLSYQWIPVLLLGAGLGFVLFTVFEPLNGLLAWLLLSPYLGPYIQIPLPTGIPDLTLERVTIACILMALILRVILKSRQLVPIGVIEKMMILYSTVRFLSAFLRSDDIGPELLVVFDETAIPFLLFVAAKNLFHSRDEGRKLCYVLLLFGLGIALHGIYQYVTHSAFTVGYVEEAQLAQLKQSHILERRAVGPFLLGQVYGGILSIIFIWILYLTLFDSRKLKRFFLVISLGLIGTGVVLSFTRSVWLAFFVSICIIVMINKRWRKIFVLSIAGVTLIFVIIWFSFPETSQFKQRITDVETIYPRLVNYKAAFLMSLEKPVIGWGKAKATFVTGRKDYLSDIGSISAEWGEAVGPAHNDFLSILVQYGLIGVVPYLAIFILIFKSSLSLMNLPPDKQGSLNQFAIFFLGMQAGYLVQAMLVDISAFTFLSSLFFIFAGVIEGLRYRTFMLNQATYRVALG